MAQECCMYGFWLACITVWTRRGVSGPSTLFPIITSAISCPFLLFLSLSAFCFINCLQKKNRFVVNCNWLSECSQLMSIWIGVPQILVGIGSIRHPFKTVKMAEQRRRTITYSVVDMIGFCRYHYWSYHDSWFTIKWWVTKHPVI
jgi:hypothetical protein